MANSTSYTPRCEFCGYPLDANGLCTNPKCGCSIKSQTTVDVPADSKNTPTA